MSRPRPLLLALGAIALTAPLGGCGDGPAPVRARGGIVELELTDYRVRPQTVRARRDSLTIRVTNTGRLPHAFRLRGDGGTRLKIPTLKPGETSARVGIRLARGKWRMFCPLANHEELGLYGTLVVR